MFLATDRRSYLFRPDFSNNNRHASGISHAVCAPFAVGSNTVNGFKNVVYNLRALEAEFAVFREKLLSDTRVALSGLFLAAGHPRQPIAFVTVWFF